LDESHPNLWRYCIKWVTRVYYFSKITNVEVCQVVDQDKIALTIVQNWICKNEIIDLKNTKNFK